MYTERDRKRERERKTEREKERAKETERGRERERPRERERSQGRYLRTYPPAPCGPPGCEGACLSYGPACHMSDPLLLIVLLTDIGQILTNIDRILTNNV